MLYIAILILMMMNASVPYQTSFTSPTPLPLERFLPFVPDKILCRWLESEIPSGGWVLDPFGVNPLLPLEAARAGYRVLVTSNNPVISFLLEIMAGAPQKNDLLSAFSELASIRKGSDRLEVHLSSLYLTHCAECKRSIPVEAFLWKRETQQPYARLYRCPHCGASGEYPITPADLEKLSSLGSGRLHRARALERCNVGDSKTQEGAIEALSHYLPRSLYFLFTVINKIEGMPISSNRRDLLTAMAIMACDQGNTLWPWPDTRGHPRQLVTPPQFRENNLWTALEQSIDLLSQFDTPIVLTEWPDLPPEEGGICLYKGKLKNVLPLPGEIAVQGAFMGIPRSSQAFWTLCAMWSGWIWGPEAVLPLKSALERQRYVWNWHAVALHSIFKYLRRVAEELPFPVFAVQPELTPGFLSASIVGAAAADFGLKGIAFNEEENTAQLYWNPVESKKPSSTIKVGKVGADAITKHLQMRAEPASYISLHAAILSALAEKQLLQNSQQRLPYDSLSQLHAQFDDLFERPGFLKRYESTAKTPQAGMYWLRKIPADLQLPLTDQIEMTAIQYFINNPDKISFQALYESLCEKFTGLFTPSPEWVRLCLESYCAPIANSSDLWQLNPGETPNSRQKDVGEISALLHQIGNQTGFSPETGQPILWIGQNNEPVYCFYCFASSIVSRFVQQPQPVPFERCVLILPGSRARLLEYKLQHNPYLCEEVSKGWRIVKFRHIRRLAERENLTRAIWETLLNMDPPTWEKPMQLPIL